MVTRYLWSPKGSKCILFPISSSPRATSGGRALSRRVPADFAAGSLIAAFCCKVLHFIASSRGDSGYAAPPSQRLRCRRRRWRFGLLPFSVALCWRREIKCFTLSSPGG